MWAYDLDLWPWRSPRLSVIRVLLLYQSTKGKFRSIAHMGQTYHVTLLTLIFNLTLVLAADAGLHPPSALFLPTLKFLSLTVGKIWHILRVCVSRPVILIFDLLILKLVRICSTCHGVPSCQFWWYYDYSFSIYGPLGNNTAQTDHGTLWPWPWNLERHDAYGWCGSSFSIRILPYTKFEVRRPCCSEDMAHNVCQH